MVDGAFGEELEATLREFWYFISVQKKIKGFFKRLFLFCFMQEAEIF